MLHTQQVLDEKNQYRRQLIDQVVATALPESRVPEEVCIHQSMNWYDGVV